MARFMGREMSRKELLRSTGNVSQIARIRSCEFLLGRSGGCKAVEVATGGGLEFTVLQDKCLDIFDLRYKGVNLSFIAKPGATAPQYYNTHNEFPHYFQGGFIATCGLRNVGSGCSDEGEQHPPHGRVGNIPADNFSVSTRWEGDEYLMGISGEMREAALFKENLVLRRRIETSLGANSLKITDSVDNETCSVEALMLLYHINFGFPFLGPGLRLMLPNGTQSKPRDEDAAKGIDAFSSFTDPVDGYREQVFYHEMPASLCGDTCVLLRNRDMNLAVYIKYNINQLPMLTQWKCMASGDYALGLEPANCHVEGREKERQMGSLKSIEPFGRAEFELEIGVLEGREIDEFVVNSKMQTDVD